MDASSYSKSEPDKGTYKEKQIIDIEPTTMIATTKLQKVESKDLEEGEHLYPLVDVGYIIDEKGVHVDPAKIQVIWDWSSPTTLKELHIFLGLADFYHKFVLGFSHITWPLIQVNEGKVKTTFYLFESQKKVFANFKHRLSSTPMPTLLDVQQPFEIEADASDYDVGVVLTQ
eukprot:PITA_05535